MSRFLRSLNSLFVTDPKNILLLRSESISPQRCLTKTNKKPTDALASRMRPRFHCSARSSLGCSPAGCSIVGSERSRGCWWRA
jgi:hypothetical protein